MGKLEVLLRQGGCRPLLFWKELRIGGEIFFNSRAVVTAAIDQALPMGYALCGAWHTNCFT